MTGAARRRKAPVLGAAIVIGLFALASIFAKKYEGDVRAFAVGSGGAGAAAYVAVTAASVVVAPVSTLPLIPLASAAWGWPAAGALSVVGWTIGAQIAFALSRIFGRPLVRKIVSVESLAAIEGRVPKKDLFWSAVLLRMAIPVDILSYALGLFSPLRGWPHLWSTLLGVTPFAFVFAYLGSFPTWIQIVVVVEIAAAGTVVYLIKKLKS